MGTEPRPVAPPLPLLMRVLRDPAAVGGFGPAQWDVVLRQARRHGLLARLGIMLEDRGLSAAIPERAGVMIAESMAFWQFNRSRIRCEIDCVMAALGDLAVPVVALKGGAYLVADLPPAGGRSASDLDILVPKDRLADVEQTMQAAGWQPSKLDRYDQHYYRMWMHELPPLWHPDRRIVVDVHHTIAPPTSRARPDAAALLRAAVPVADRPGLAVLAPADMVLHAAIHLFNEEMTMGLRDLVDLHMLLGHFGADPAFWSTLAARARHHGLERPLYYLLSTCVRLLGTAVPRPYMAAVRRDGAPNVAVRTLMPHLILAALAPDDPDRPRMLTAVSRRLLYVRVHWLRMPPAQLARHLGIKLGRRLRPQPPTGQAQPAPTH